MNETIVFFRNDDVRNSLDNSLISITELFISHNIPVSHAVEPANVTEHVVKWLISVKESYPDLIEIIQHGYDHSQKAVTTSGEFGGSRTYSEQFQDIHNGRELMTSYFGDYWSRVFTFPFGAYNFNTLLALQKLDYKKISTGYRHNLKRSLFNYIGHGLKKKFILKKPVNYFNEKIPSINILELPVSINFTKKVIDKDNSIQKSVSELEDEFNLLSGKLNLIGFLMHHRWWKASDIKTMDNFLDIIKKQNCKISRLEVING